MTKPLATTNIYLRVASASGTNVRELLGDTNIKYQRCNSAQVQGRGTWATGGSSSN